MSGVFKKIIKRAFIVIISLGSLLAISFVRLLFGNSFQHVNISKFNKDISGLIDKTKLTEEAKADTPGCSGCACSCSSGEGDGCGSGGSGSGDGSSDGSSGGSSDGGGG